MEKLKMNKKDIIIARCPGSRMGDHLDKFMNLLREQLPASEYIIFIDALSDRFDIELVTKPIVIQNNDELDLKLEKLNSLIKEIRDKDLKQV